MTAPRGNGRQAGPTTAAPAPVDPRRLRGSLPFSTHLSRLVLMVALPLVILAVTLIVWTAQERRDDLLRRIEGAALGLQVAVDREIALTIATLEALATSPALDQALGDASAVTAFHRQASETVARRPDALGALYLFDTAIGARVMDSAIPPGMPVPPAAGATLGQVLVADQPLVGDLVRAADSQWVVPVAVPVRRDGRIVAVLAATMRPTHLGAVLRREMPAEGAIAVLVDRGGIVVARNAEEARFVGLPAVPGIIRFQATTTTQPASGPGHTVAGEPVYAALRRLAVAPFTVGYGAPRAMVDAPLRRALLIAGGGCLVALLMATGAASWQGRRLGSEVSALGADALLLADGRALPPRPHSSVAEVEAARDALTRSTAALAESEARFTRAVAAARMGTWEWDATTNTLTGSPGREALYGRAPGSLPTREALLATIHPEDRDAVAASAEAAMNNASDRGYWAEFRTIWPDGTVRWLRTQGRVELAADGSPLRMSGAVVDITENRLAIAALRDSERRLRLAQDAAGIGVWERDLVTGEATWSDREFRLHGMEPGGTPPDADTLRAMIMPEDEAQATLLFERMRDADTTAEEHGAAMAAEYRIRRCDTGAIRWLQVFGRALPGPDGRPARVIGVSLDVTERREAEQRQALLMREVDHRAKNALAVALSVVQLAPRNLAPEAFAAVVTGRIAAMARAHSLLADERWAGADLAALAVGEFAAHADHVSMQGPGVRLEPGAAQPVAMLLHELGTNASKHGALSVAGGRVDLGWEMVEDSLRLSWRESGVARIAGAPAGSGFGLRLMTALARQQLGGGVTFDWSGTDGIAVTVQIPARHVAWYAREPAPGGAAPSGNGARTLPG